VPGIYLGFDMKSTVTCNGCFDGLHPGHLFFLGYCKAQADSLIVGINDDDYIRRHKRENPYFDSGQRRNALLALGFVDDVVVFKEKTPIEMIRRLRPDAHCTGIEYKERCPEAPICEELGIDLILIPRVKGWASSGLEGESLDMMRFYMDRLLSN